MARAWAVGLVRVRAGLAIAAGLGLSAARPAQAAEVRTLSRTIGEGYMVRLPGPEAQLLARRRLVQYVGLGVYGILPPRRPDQPSRDPDDGQLRVVASMRLRHDFGDFTRLASDDAQRLLRSLDGRQIDLMFGYLEGERLGGWVDLRAGRQLEMSGLDFYAFDGGWVRVRTPAHIAIEAFGGLQVDATDLFGYETFQLDGTAGTQVDAAPAPMIGAAFSTADTRYIDARFAYRRTWTPEAAAQREIEDDALAAGPGVDQELVTATLALRLARNRVFPNAAFRYNLGTGRVDDLAVGLAWSVTPLHQLRATYIRTIPLFDLDSIFNVFAVEPFEDARVLWEVRPNERWAISARGQARFFRSTTTAALDQAPEKPLRVGAGGGAAASYRVRRFAARIDGFGLGGEGGARAGASLDSRTHLVWDRFAFDARTYFVWYRDEVDENRNGYSLAVQAGGNLRLAPGIYLDVVGEELVTPFLAPAFRLLGILSFDWTFRVGQR